MGHTIRRCPKAPAEESFEEPTDKNASTEPEPWISGAADNEDAPAFEEENNDEWNNGGGGGGAAW